MTMIMSNKALEEYGLVNLGNVNRNLSPPVLIEHALARKEGVLASNGAFAAVTGSHTGRSPKDKFIGEWHIDKKDPAPGSVLH